MTDGVLRHRARGGAADHRPARRGGVGGAWFDSTAARGGFPSSVLTADVTNALSAVLEAQAREAGAAFFLVGHFGSASPTFSRPLPSWLQAPVARMATAGARVCGKRPVEPGRGGRCRTPGGASGRRPTRGPGARSGLARPGPAPAPSEHRPRAAWDGVLAAAAEAAASSTGTAGAGLVVLLDELQRVPAAKQGPALVEDLRFLQFLGELGRESPVVVVAALQESIEEVANVSQRGLARDPRRANRTLGLSMRHVEDLCGAGWCVSAGSRAVVERRTANRGGLPELASAPTVAALLPPAPGHAARCWKGRASCFQQRGVVDFISPPAPGALAGHHALAGRGCLELVTPTGSRPLPLRLHERVQTRRLAETVMP